MKAEISYASGEVLMKLSKNYKILILSHFYKRTTSGGGPPQEIRDYFIPKVDIVSYIEHPFPYSNDHRSSMSIYKNGKLEKQIFAPPIYGPEFVYYILDIIFVFYFYIRAPYIYDVCVALDNLNTFSVLPFRKLNLIKRLIFYTIDYIPSRFKSKILNSIYHYIDRVACYNTDDIWVLSPRMISTRRHNGVDSKKTAPSVVLPMGADLSRIKTLPFEKINRHQIVYVGILLEKQGVQLILEALLSVIKKIPDVKFVVIGKGEYENKLKLLTKELKITQHVDFRGFVENHRLVEKILCQSAIGVAPYVTDPENYTSYTDPAKPKLYMGCGLPVIITKVPSIARAIQSKKAGVVVDYTTKSVADSIVKLLSDDFIYKEYRKNVIKLSKKYDTNKLIRAALDKTN